MKEAVRCAEDVNMFPCKSLAMLITEIKGKALGSV